MVNVQQSVPDVRLRWMIKTQSVSTDLCSFGAVVRANGAVLALLSVCFLVWIVFFSVVQLFLVVRDFVAAHTSSDSTHDQPISRGSMLENGVACMMCHANFSCDVVSVVMTSRYAVDICAWRRSLTW